MSRPPTVGLTERQEETFRWVKGFIREHGLPPTVREIGRAFGIKSSSVFYLLKELEKKGYLRRGDLGARSLIIQDRNARSGVPVVGDNVADDTTDQTADLVRVPVVGQVAAGQPILAEENVIGEVLVERKITRSGCCFALEVEGDSMIGAGIRGGDMVIVRQQPVAESGDIVVALLNDEATVKRLFIREERIDLKPENPKHRTIPIGPGDVLLIQGKVVAVRRRDT